MPLVAAGALFGTALAFALHESRDERPPPARSPAVGSATFALSAAPSPPPATPLPSPSLAVSAVHPAPAGSAPSSSAPSNAAFPRPAPAPDSAEAVRRAELSCYDKKPEACRLAAEAYRAGAVVAADPEKARTFLKVELTYLVRGCEKRLIAACLRLAERYARGEGLPENASTAEQLLVHVKELCARAKMKAPAPECALVASR